jgi:uncharacterized repeat protein (TIGR03803 family)
MKRSTYVWSIIALTILRLPAAHDAGREASAVAKPHAVKAYGHLPLSFEANQGQTDQRVKFLSHGTGYSLFLTGDEAVLALKKPGGSVARDRQLKAAVPSAEPPAVVRMRLVGANAAAKVTGLAELPGKSNYFIGNDPKKWRTNVPNWAKVKYENVYPGVDLVYYGDQGQLEYDFVVQAGADPKAIQLGFAGAESPRIDGKGDLVLGADGGEVIFHKPVVYQPATDHGQRTRDVVDGEYLLKGGRVAFEVASYDKTRPLVIDPTLAYSTFLGGSSGDNGSAIAVDASGNAYITGGTASSNFPVTPGVFQTTLRSVNGNAFITKLNAIGSALVYSTYLGGSGGEAGSAIAIDGSGNAYVVGETLSSDFPTTPGALQTTGAGDIGFVSKLNASGSALLYSTYLGGSPSCYVRGFGAAVNSSGNAYVAGYTCNRNFPTTPGAFETNFLGNPTAFVSKLNAAGSALVYSTFLGSADAGALAIDSSGNAYVTGDTGTGFPTTPGALQTTIGGGLDAFVSKLNATGSALLYSTYLGGSGDDFGGGIAVDASGNVYVGGNTSSTNFPVTPGAFQTTLAGGFEDAFISKLNTAGSALLYSTYLGGSGADFGGRIAVDASGNAYVAGSTYSSDFPITPGAFQSTYGGNIDAFFSKLNAAGSALLYSTYMGGNGQDNGFGIAVDPSGNPYVTGATASPNFPTTPGAFQTSLSGTSNAFVSRIVPGIAPGPFTILAELGGAGARPGYVTLAQGLDGNLYGTAPQGGRHLLGTVFQATPTGTVTAIYNFGSSPGDGAAPFAGLVLGTDGNFYGTTSAGGASGLGTVFKITPSGVLTTLHSFNGSDGANPKTALMQASDGNFYGVTLLGGAYGKGTIFRIQSGRFVLLNSFQFPSHPLGALVQGPQGDLYVSLQNAAPNNCGMVYRFLPGVGSVTLHRFNCTDGAFPAAALAEGLDGAFYGTTQQGGSAGLGTLFKTGPFSGFTSLASFDGSTEGSHPTAPLLLATDGNFYGTASAGGACSNGTIFKAAGGTVTPVHNLCGADGTTPLGGLVQHTNGTLYGVTRLGGTHRSGTLYSLSVGLSPTVKTLPTSAPIGATATILGTDLLGTTSVRFNGTAAAYTIVSGSEITATVPAGATTGTVQVVTPGGTLSSNVNFGVAPVIASFSPTSGPAGTSVLITGESFTGATRVFVGSLAVASFTVDSNTQITATVPSGAKTAHIVVTRPGGIATSTGIFTITP